MMLCVLVFVNFGHAWIQGAGNVLVKSCYYECGQTKASKGQWYDRKYSVPPRYICPKRFAEA
jgi:hypothetical protein